MKSGKSIIWALVVTFIASNGIHTLTGFKYNIFDDGFVPSKLFIDVLMWAGIYVISYLILLNVTGEKNINKKR